MMSSDTVAPHSSTLPSQAARTRRQLSLFLGGAGFLLLSVAVTRRAIARRYRIALPAFYMPSNQPPRVNGAFEAFEAFNLATLNVLSAGMFLAGGTMWAFDIGGVEDLRARAQAKLKQPTKAEQPTDEDLEKLEEWLNSVLTRKDYKEIKEQVQRELDKAKNGSGPSSDG
jgi:hypothetical protein